MKKCPWCRQNNVEESDPPSVKCGRVKVCQGCHIEEHLIAEGMMKPTRDSKRFGKWLRKNNYV